jgi:hypothetical protein
LFSFARAKGPFATAEYIVDALRDFKQIRSIATDRWSTVAERPINGIAERRGWCDTDRRRSGEQWLWFDGSHC